MTFQKEFRPVKNSEDCIVTEEGAILKLTSLIKSYFFTNPFAMNWM